MPKWSEVSYPILTKELPMKNLFSKKVKTERARPEVVASCRKASCCH